MIDISGMRLELIQTEEEVSRVERSGNGLAKCDPLDSDREAAAEMLRRTSALLDELELDWTLADGSLLGLIRNGDLIPGDNDIDIKLPQTQISDAMIRGFERIGGTERSRWYCKGKVTNISFGFGRLQVDVNSYQREGDSIWFHAAYHRPRNGGPFNGALSYNAPHKGRKPATLLGATVQIPENAEDFLACCYGPDWRIPATKWNHMFSNYALRRITGDSEALMFGLYRALWARGYPPSSIPVKRQIKTPATA